MVDRERHWLSGLRRRTTSQEPEVVRTDELLFFLRHRTCVRDSVTVALSPPWSAPPLLNTVQPKDRPPLEHRLRGPRVPRPPGTFCMLRCERPVWPSANKKKRSFFRACMLAGGHLETLNLSMQLYQIPTPNTAHHSLTHRGSGNRGPIAAALRRSYPRARTGGDRDGRSGVGE